MGVMGYLRITALLLLLGGFTRVAPALPPPAQPATTTHPSGPLSATQAIESFELEPGLTVQLVAGEPLVASPCAIAWDEHGRMYVAENRGYPLGGPGGKPVGRVALLEDMDGDGLPDKRSEFATGLSFPNGLLPWRGGVIVTDAPDVLYLKDTDSDGRADVREVLLTGFSTVKTTQLRVNDPTIGPDGWVYLAGGLDGGKIHSPKRPLRVLDLARTDVKFRPDSGEIEPVEGKGQYGLSFDDAGHRFVCYNRVQVQHAPLPSRYLARNKHVTSPGVLQNCPELVRNPLLGNGNDAGARIFPISSNLTTADSHAGTYSAACAVHIARGDALPDAYLGMAWSCDPTGNLVHCDALEPSGGSFQARRMRENSEALRSSDDWFRPVFLADGPDGALYVCDMYRRTIEHPEYLPEEVRKHTDFESGKDMGRIWRIARSDLQSPVLAEARTENVKHVAQPGAEEVVAALRSSNGWARDTAVRLITERGDSVHAAHLEALASAKDAPAAAVVASLNLLANGEALSDVLLLAAIQHPAPAVRENAVRLAERRLAAAPELADHVLALTGDPHVHVRYAAVLAAGELTHGSDPQTNADVDDRIIDALRRTAATGDVADKWFRAALGASLPVPDGAWKLLATLGHAPAEVDEGALALLHELGRLCAVETPPEKIPASLDKLLTTIAGRSFHARAAVLVGFIEQAGAPAAAEFGRRVHQEPDGDVAQTVAEAYDIAADRSTPLARRIGAVSLLAPAGDARREAALLSLVSFEEPVELAVMAVRGLLEPPRGTGVAAALLETARWSRYSPAVRSAVLTLLTGRPQYAATLVDALESGAVPVVALTQPQRAWLSTLDDETVRARAASLLSGGGVPQDRRQAFEDAKGALQLTGDAVNGRRMFSTHCATCHRLDREGHAVGPDLFGIRNQSKESILLHIVVPEQEIAPNFAAYDGATKDGRVIGGIMIADTSTSVTLRQALGIEETIPRDRIKQLAVSRYSLMPPGLEQAMTRQELADLLAFLRGEK